MNDFSALPVLAAAGAPLALASLLVVRPWRGVVCRAAPVAAVPALALALLGPVGAKASLPWLVQHTVLELDAVGRVFLGFTSGALAKMALKANVGFLPEGWALALGLLLPLAAAGTTLKMARFLWLSWRPPGHAAEGARRGLRAPWMLLVTATLAGVWLLPGTLEVLPRTLSPEKLWDALWPLLLGGTLAALGAWLRRGFSRDLSRWLPAGDLGVLLERLLARLQRGAPIEGRSHREQESDRGESSAQEASRGSLRLRRAGEGIVRLEAHLRSWPVAGALWLLLMVLLIGLLAAANH